MKSFYEFYLQMEGRDPNWAPSPSQIGDSVQQSAVRKLVNGIKAGKLSGPYVDSEIVQTTFGLSNEELNFLHRSKCIIKGSTGVEIDRQQLDKLSQGLIKTVAPYPAQPTD